MTAPVLAPQIKRAYQAAVGAARSAIEHAIECGKLVLEAKAQVGHSGWLAWIDADLSFGARQAQKYCRLVQHADALPNATSDAHLGIDQALAVVAEPEVKEPQRPVTEVFDRALVILEQMRAAAGAAERCDRDALEAVIDGCKRVANLMGLLDARIAELQTAGAAP